MTEQFVMQELKASGFTPFYWGREKGAAEVDFVLQWRNEIVPVEVKAVFRKKSKSLDVYRNLYHPAHSVRATLQNFGITGDLYSLPLYMTGNLSEILNR
jgi:predicted AAA+ superfamily ATPase